MKNKNIEKLQYDYSNHINNTSIINMIILIILIILVLLNFLFKSGYVTVFSVITFLLFKNYLNGIIG